MTMTDEQKKAQIQSLQDAAKEQREYERKRGLFIDEAVLIATMLRQRLPQGPGIAPVTGDGMMLAAATIYAGWLAHGEGAK